MKKTLLLSFISFSCLGSDFSVEVVKKDTFYGAAVKFSLVRLEFLQEKNHQIFKNTEVLQNKEEGQVTFALEPDLKLFQYDNFSFEMNPLIGITHHEIGIQKTGTGKECKQHPVTVIVDKKVVKDVANPNCESTYDENYSTITNSLSFKVDYKFKSLQGIHFYIKSGIEGILENKHETKSIIGFSLPF